MAGWRSNGSSSVAERWSGLSVDLACGCPIEPTLDEERWETRRKLHLEACVVGTLPTFTRALFGPLEIPHVRIFLRLDCSWLVSSSRISPPTL